ncbi:RNA polymerase sigma factor [Chitinophaga flava]|uniref:RNA polymerase sigma factor 70 region 4 type 2 domain-containing protein n=1 Tax=Chitinophaga flava TaxID=2259036 RepID=A0A365XTS2_9BACT|nr:sigma-70 family RNA polymerase sigma factor [Chitinophaga flava]RBL89733.1 hypothetical protein DF182_24890 [Chitinophaga flava]
MTDFVHQSSEGENFAHEYFQLFREGNERGLNYIYNKLYKSVFSFARKIIQDEFEITTIIQNAFKLIWDLRNTMQNVAHIKAVICNSVRWGCYNYLRSGYSRIKRGTMSLEHYEDQGISLAVYDPQREIIQWEKALDEQEKVDLIEKAIEHIPEKRKKIMQLILQGYSYKQIAKVTGQSHQYIVAEEERCIRILQPIIDRIRKAHDASKQVKPICISDYKIYLSPLQTRIFELFYENGYSFPEISKELYSAQGEIIRQFFKATEIIDKVNKPGKS